MTSIMFLLQFLFLNCNFPKQTFGQKKPVSRSFQSAWFSWLPFLRYTI